MGRPCYNITGIGNGMTFISKKHKFIFLHIPKCAGVSIEASMYSAGIINDLEWTNVKSINWLSSKIRKRMPMISKKPKWGIDTLRKLEYLHSGHIRYLDLIPHIIDIAEYNIYSVVRDPVESCISRYNYIISRKNHHKGHRLNSNRYRSFDEFLKTLGKVEYRSQFSYIFNGAGLKPKNCKLFSINKMNDFVDLFEKNHGITLEIPHKNKGKYKKIILDEKQVQIIHSIYNYDYDKINELK